MQTKSCHIFRKTNSLMATISPFDAEDLRDIEMHLIKSFYRGRSIRADGRDSLPEDLCAVNCQSDDVIGSQERSNRSAVMCLWCGKTVGCLLLNKLMVYDTGKGDEEWSEVSAGWRLRQAIPS